MHRSAHSSCLDRSPCSKAAMCTAQCTQWAGEARGLEGQKLAWVDSAQIKELDVLPADIPLLPAVEAAVQQHACANTLGM